MIDATNSVAKTRPATPAAAGARSSRSAALSACGSRPRPGLAPVPPIGQVFRSARPDRSLGSDDPRRALPHEMPDGLTRTHVPYILERGAVGSAPPGGETYAQARPGS